MDLKGVRAFCSVADGGGFSRAAASLGVAQSVLSRQVSALESELGGRLFHRTGRGVQATELGASLLPRAKALLAEAEQLAIEARGQRSSPSGTVDLGIVPGWAQPLITTLVQQLMADYPRIRLRVHEAYSGQVEDWMASGRVEVAVFNRYRRGVVRGVNVPRSGRFRFVCYVALEKMQEGEAKLAAMAAFVADPFLKFVVVVDHDVDINNDTDVLHAIATRVRADGCDIASRSRSVGRGSVPVVVSTRRSA